VTSSDWHKLLDGMSRETRIKALLSYELAADRADGQSVESVVATLRAVAVAEGLDADHPWIPAAAACIAQERPATAARSPLLA
jgi:hypothetical protein